MRTNNFIPITIKIPFPVDRPDANGNIYSREAVINAIHNFPKNAPILFASNEGEPVVIGHTCGGPIITTEDVEQGTFNFAVKGEIFAGGTQDMECVLEEVEDNVVKSFKITGVGFSI